MEARLQKLVDSLMRVAEIRNMDFDNPVKVTLQTGELYPVVTLVSYQEPNRGKYPLDVIWVCADPVVMAYKKIYKRVSKDPDPATPAWKHTWLELSQYDQVFHPNQHYDEGDDENAIAIQEIYDHINNVTGNPHMLTPERIGALPLAGGTMLGDLLLFADPTQASPANQAVTKAYVDNKTNVLFSAVDTLNSQYALVYDTLNNITNSELPNLNNRVTYINNRISANDTKLTAAINSIAELQVTVADNTESIGLLAAKIQGISGTGTIPVTFKHFQSIPDYVWDVPHNMNTLFVLPSITDLTGEVMQPDSIKIIDKNNIQVIFNAPLAGKASLIGIV